MPPDSVAFRIAVVARRDRRLGSIASQTQTCISGAITSIDFPNLAVDERRFDVTHDFNFVGQTSGNVALRALDRHELRHSDTFLGNQHWLPTLVNVIHNAQAMGLEFSGRDCLHGHLQTTMVKLKWL